MQRFRSIERDSVELALSDGRTVVVTRVRDPRARRLKLCVDERGARLTMPPRASAISGGRWREETRAWLAVRLGRCATGAGRLRQAGVTEGLPLRGQLVPLRWSEGRYSRLRREDDGGLV